MSEPEHLNPDGAIDTAVDLSSLDPSRDQRRWDQLVETVAKRGWSVRQRRLTVTHQLRMWAGPTLAIAAGAALVSWLGALAQETGREAQATQEPTYQLASWAMGDERPSVARILHVLGDSHVD